MDLFLRRNTFYPSDVNECIAVDSPCDQGCENTIGSYICSCSEGWFLGGDGHTCLGKCVMVGAQLFFCGCCILSPHLYRYMPLYNHTVLIHAGDEECKTNNGGCEDECHEMDDGYYCTCNEVSWTLGPDSHSCVGG